MPAEQQSTGSCLQVISSSTHALAGESCWAATWLYSRQGHRGRRPTWTPPLGVVKLLSWAGPARTSSLSARGISRDSRLRLRDSGERGGLC